MSIVSLCRAAAIALLGSILLPSTKRAHFDYQRFHDAQLNDAPTTQPQSQPTNIRRPTNAEAKPKR